MLPEFERSAENAFGWLTAQTNYTIESERGYKSIKKDKNSTFVFKTTGADVSIFLLNDFRNDSTTQTEITSAFFAPFRNQKLTKIINFKTGILIYKNIKKLQQGNSTILRPLHVFALFSSVANYCSFAVFLTLEILISFMTQLILGCQNFGTS